MEFFEGDDFQNFVKLSFSHSHQKTAPPVMLVNKKCEGIDLIEKLSRFTRKKISDNIKADILFPSLSGVSIIFVEKKKEIPIFIQIAEYQKRFREICEISKCKKKFFFFF